MIATYAPDRSDLVQLEFTPQTGSEQTGRRPALEVAPKAHNTKVDLTFFWSVTSWLKGDLFENALL